MSEKGIKPALTPEQWAAAAEAVDHHMQSAIQIDESTIKGLGWTRADELRSYDLRNRVGDGVLYVPRAGRQGVAALCLHGQPFGFTREMVWALRELGHPSQTTEDQALAYQAIDHIEALLPPE